MKRRGSAIFYSTILLTGANFLLRLAAMSFQVYLSGRVGASGIGLLQLVLSVTALSFTVGSAGVRTCAMYLSAGELGRGRREDIRSVITGCCQYSLFFSCTAAILLWRAAPWLSGIWTGGGTASAALRLYALFLPLRCLHGVLTGYYTAGERVRVMVAAAFLEQGCSMLVTYLLLARQAGGEVGAAAFAVVAGSCAADVLGFVFLLAMSGGGGQREKRRPPYGRILRTALPLALSDTLRAGLNTIEDLLIPRQLSLYRGTVNAMADYGMIRGMVFPVLMFPAAILFSLAELLVPEFSRCAARGSRNRVQYLARRGLRAALLFGLCAGGLLFAAADTLGEALYREPQAGKLIRLYAPFVPMLYLDAIVDAMCKGLGQQNANARYNTLTSFLDVFLLWTLLPRLGLDGYYFSFAAAHAVNFALSLRRLTRVSGIRLPLGGPLRAAVCTAAAAAGACLPASGSVLLRGGCYILLLLGLWMLFRVVDGEDIRWLRSLTGGRR